MRILLCVVDSPLVEKLAYYTARLFPSAEYHLITVIKPVMRKIMLTRIYEHVLYSSAKHIQEKIENILKKNNVGKVVRIIERGDPVDKITEYVEKHRVSLLGLTPRTTIEYNRLGKTARKVIEKSNKPILLYTIHSDLPYSSTLHILELGEAETPMYLLRNISFEKITRHRISLGEVDGARISEYDLIVIGKKDFLEIIKKNIYQYLSAPLLIIP